MNRELVVSMLRECVTENERTLIKVILSMIDDRPEDTQGLSEEYLTKVSQIEKL